MVRSTRKTSGRREQQLEDLSDDEIESFNKRRIGGLDSDNESGSSSNASELDDREEVLGEVNSDDDDDDSDSSDGDGEAEKYNDSKSDKDLERISKDWGNKRSAFFKEGEESESEDSDEEAAAQDAEEEEAEARRIKKQLLQNLTQDDLELGSSDEEDGKKKRKKKSKRKSTAGRDSAKLERVAAQAPELLGLLAEFKSNLETLSKHVAPVLGKARQSELPTENGLSYLETKFQAMLTYCINIAFYLYMRSKGENVRDHPVIAELVRVRTVLEKLKPLDAKLKGQIDELIAAGNNNKAAATNGLNGKKGAAKSNSVGGARPNIDDLMEDSGSEMDDQDSLDDDDDSDIESESDEERTSKKASAKASNKVYKAPKHMVVSNSFQEDERAEARNAKRQAQRVKKLKNSELLRDLTSEFSDRPMEEPSVGSTHADLKNRKVAAERTRYEEENFVRLQESKKEKTERIRREREAEYGLRNSLNELEDFGDLEGLVSRVDRDASFRVNEKARREQELSKFMAKLAQDEANDSRKKRSKKGSGDQDVRIRDPVEMRNNIAQKAARESAYMEQQNQEREEKRARKRAKRDIDRETTVPASEESSLYASTDAETKKRKADRKQKYTLPDLQPSAPAHLLPEGASRKANYQILKNHGLKAYKKKEDRNPRVKRRMAYEKKLKARQGQVMSMRKNEGETYSGEASGLRSGLVASRRPGK